MNSVVKFGVVPKASVSDEIKAEVIEKLKRALAEAESGQVDEILIIMQHPGEDYTQLATCTQSLSKWIGYLTITIDDWIDTHRAIERENAKP